MGIQNSAIADNGIQNLNLSDLLKIEFKKDSYFESQLVEGVVTFQPKQNMVFNDILIKFQQYEYFSYIIEEPNKIVSDLNTHVFFEKPMNAGYFLNAQRVQGGMFSLNPGTYKIPFQFTLPPNIPPSFEYPIKNRRAALRYIFSAQVLSPYAKTITESYLWVKARPINVPDTIKHENYITVKNVGIINRGKSGIALFTMSNNFKINDMLPFTVDIYNEDCGVQVKEVKISIKRIVTFMDKGKEYQHRTAILRRKYHCICDRNSKNTFHYDDIQIRDDEFRDVDFNRSLSPYPFLNDLNLLMPNIRSKFIKCEYSLKATSYFDLSVLGKNRPRVEMPIFITHQIQKEFEYEKNQNLNKRQQQLYSGVDLNKVENTYKPGNNKNMNNMNNNNMNRPMGNNNNNNSGNNMGNSSSNQSGSSTGGKKYSYQAYIAARNLNNPNKSQNNNNNINNNNNNWKSNSSFQPSNIILEIIVGIIIVILGTIIIILGTIIIIIIILGITIIIIIIRGEIIIIAITTIIIILGEIIITKTIMEEEIMEFLILLVEEMMISLVLIISIIITCLKILFVIIMNQLILLVIMSRIILLVIIMDQIIPLVIIITPLLQILLEIIIIIIINHKTHLEMMLLKIHLVEIQDKVLIKVLIQDFKINL